MQNPLPGIPLIESPLFPQQKAGMALTSEEERIATSLFENGFAIMTFPDADLNSRIERVKARLSPHFGIDFADKESDKTHGERRIQDAWKSDEDVRAIAANEHVLALLGKIYGRPAFPFQTLNFPVGTQQAAHSDSVHFSSLPERFMCGVWLAMEDVHEDAGPLFYIPGSHRWPIMTNALIGRRGQGEQLQSAQDPYGPAWDALRSAYGIKEATFLPRKGEALIWCANLLHGGMPQTDPRRTRWSQVTHYYFDACVYYTPAFSDEILGRLQLREMQSIVDGGMKESHYLGEIVRPPKRKSRLQKVMSALASR